MRRKSELMSRGDKPFKVLANMGPNVYKLELPRDVAIPATFNATI